MGSFMSYLEKSDCKISGVHCIDKSLHKKSWGIELYKGVCNYKMGKFLKVICIKALAIT